MFGTTIVTQKVRLRKDHILDSKKVLTQDAKKKMKFGILKKDHSRDSKKESHL